MKDVVIIDALRTPIARAGEKSFFKDLRSDDLGTLVLNELIKRNNLDPNLIDEIIFGCANQSNEQGQNVARMISLLAKLPVTIPSYSINRLCASGMQAVVSAYDTILTGRADIILAGGVESMTHLSMNTNKNPHPKLGELYSNSVYSMGETAENVALRYDISRQTQDEFALVSHKKAIHAIDNNLYNDEIMPIKIGEELIKIDQGPRRESSLEKLANLKPLFKENGSVTAGNSCQISDGACVLLLMSQDIAYKLGYKPLAKIIGAKIVGVDPNYMGIGPIPAAKKLLEKLKYEINDIDIFEINEAFSVVGIVSERELNIPSDKLNPLGGAIALGHPLGMSGARLISTLAHQLKKKNLHSGLAAMCIGYGQGISMVIENISK
jgi:acetyl-CoA acetyltransferase family protein